MLFSLYYIIKIWNFRHVRNSARSTYWQNMWVFVGNRVFYKYLSKRTVDIFLLRESCQLYVKSTKRKSYWRKFAFLLLGIDWQPLVRAVNLSRILYFKTKNRLIVRFIYSDSSWEFSCFCIFVDVLILIYFKNSLSVLRGVNRSRILGGGIQIFAPR